MPTHCSVPLAAAVFAAACAVETQTDPGPVLPVVVIRRVMAVMASPAGNMVLDSEVGWTVTCFSSTLKQSGCVDLNNGLALHVEAPDTAVMVAGARLA